MSQRYYSSGSSERPCRPTSHSSTSSSFKDIQRFGAGISQAFTTPVTHSFSAGQSSAHIPLPDSRSESPHSATSRVGTSDGMLDAERGNTSPAQRQETPKKRPFSFMITGAPRWTWVHALVLAISLIAIGCSVAAIVLSVQHHGHGQAVAGAAVPGSAASEFGSSLLPGSTMMSTAQVSSSESRSSNKPRSATIPTLSPSPPSPSPSTASVSAATAPSQPPPSSSPSANGAADPSPAATSQTTPVPESTTQLQQSPMPPWTSFTAPDPTTTWDVSWSAGASDPRPITVGQAFRGEMSWPSSELITHAAYEDGRPFGTHTYGPASSDSAEGGRAGGAGVAADRGGESWPDQGLVHKIGDGGRDDLPKFQQYGNAAVVSGDSARTLTSTIISVRPSVTAMPLLANTTISTRSRRVQ